MELPDCTISIQLVLCGKIWKRDPENISKFYFSKSKKVNIMDLKEIFEKSKSVEVIENTDGTTEIRINRKSRFIRNDAEKIMEKCRKAGALIVKSHIKAHIKVLT
jgi:hypothetical protein